MFLEIVMLVIHYIQLTQLRYPSTKVFAEYWTVCTVIKLFGTPCTLWHLQNIGNNIEDNNYSMKSRYFKINREKKVQAMHVRTLFACFISFIYFILLIFWFFLNVGPYFHWTPVSPYHLREIVIFKCPLISKCPLIF